MSIVRRLRILCTRHMTDGIVGIFEVCHEIASILYSKIFFSGYHIYVDTTTTILGLKYMEIGSLSVVGKYNRIEVVGEYGGIKFSPKLKIGCNVAMYDKNHIGCAKYVEIGDNCLFGSNVYLTDHNHGWYRGDNQSDISVPPAQRDLGCEEVILGKNVWVGENVVILPGSHIGDNVIIGANSVVHGDIPANSIAVGSPAKVVKMWSEETKKWERE